MDLTLVTPAAFEAGNWDTQCINRIRSTQTKRVSASNPNLYTLQQAEAEAEAKATVQSGLNVTEAGVVGAMVTLGAVLVALLAAYFAGVVAFGKGKKPPKHTYNDSSVSRRAGVGLMYRMPRRCLPFERVVRAARDEHNR